jgi:hypothetical protein
MEMVDQGMQNIRNLDNIAALTFEKDFVAAGYDPALGKSRRQLVHVLVARSEEINQGNVVQCNGFFDQ